MKDIQTDPIDTFLQLVQAGINSWSEAAKIARAELALDSEWADRVAEKNKVVTAQFIHRFASIGVKFIPQLAISECPGAKRLRSLPLQMQEGYFYNPPSLLIGNNGNWEQLKVDIHNMTPDQAAQVFADDHVRTDGEQRAWIEDRKAKQTSPPSKLNQPYRVVGNKLIVMVPCQFSRKELAKILSDMD